MARIDKRTRNRRLTGLAVVVLVVVLVPVLIIRWSCGGAGDADGDSTQQAGDVTVPVGERVVRGEAAITVTAFTSVPQPTLPPSPAAEGASPQPGTEQTFYQAFVWLENGGAEPIRVDPRQFSLLADGKEFPPDLTRSGPAARTMLKGASLQMIVTLIGPAGAEARLRYESPWSQGVIVFEGEQKPAGMAALGARS